MTDPAKALTEFPSSAVAAASTFAECTLAERARRALVLRETDLATGRVLIVDQSDSAAYQTTSEAVAEAHTGDRVLVRPGHYHESVVIDKAISVEGDGDREVILIEAMDGPAFIVTSRTARLAGLTLVSRRSDPNRHHSSTLVLSTEDALVERLIVRDGDGIDVERGRPTIRGCLVANNRYIGIWVHDGASPTIEFNEVYGNAESGIFVIGSGSDPLIRKNIVHDGENDGIWVNGGASPTIESNEVSRHAVSGITVGESRSDPLIRKNVVHDGENHGIWVYDGASPTIESNEVSRHAVSGITVRGSESDPLIRKNVVHDGEAFGIYVHAGASPTIEGNEVFGNALPGIFITDAGSDPLIHGNTVRDGQDVGIFVHEGAAPTIEANEVYRNQGAGIWVEDDGSSPVVRGNSVRD